MSFFFLIDLRDHGACPLPTLRPPPPDRRE